MLMITPARSFKDPDVTAYVDDTQFWKYYLIPGNVSIRRDAKNQPVFLLIKYAFSDQDREENKNLPHGGGYMVFDTELSIPKDALDKITKQLQQEVNDTWNQLKAIAESQGQSVQGAGISSFHNLNGAKTSASLSVGDVLLGLGPDRPEAPPGDKAPTVIIGTPTYTKGTFHIMAPQSEGLISHRVAEGPVSLTGGNIVSANMDLTAAGATFMEKTLTNLDGSGGTDLTPIQALYELKFWARVPPVKVTVTADSRSLGMSVRSIYHDYEGNGCDEDSMTHSDQQLKMAVDSGLIKVQIDAGTLSLSDDFLQEIRSSALKTVMDQIKENFFDKKPAPPPPEDDKTKDFINSDQDVYYMKSELNFDSMHFGYSETLQSIVEWPVNPQGTLQTFLAGVSAQEMKKYVRVVDLEDQFFKSLGLTATVFADWANEPIAFVEVQIRYNGNDENNQPVEKVETFTFTKDHTSDFWDPSLIGSKREYEYRWRMAYIGKEAGEFTDWETDTTPRLNLSIANVGKIVLPVLAGNIDFAQVTKQVQVDVDYSDPGSGVPEEIVTLVLNNSALEKTYSRYIYTNWDQPIKYRTRFFLKNDQSVETDWQQTQSRQLLINEPNTINRLDVQLVPAGSWDGVQQTVVNLRYSDAVNNVFSDTVFNFKSTDEFRTWTVIIKDLVKRKFQYKILASFKDGSAPYQTNWLDADGDQALPVVVKQAPRLAVKLLPNLLDFKVTPIVTVTLHYDDPQANLHKVDTFPFSAATEATWSFPIADDSMRKYRSVVTHNTGDGQEIKQSEVSTDETVLVVPKLLVPEIAVEVHPKVISFVETPVVEVDVNYQDPDHNFTGEETLVFTATDPQKFRFQVDKNSPRDYTITVTYYLADGKVVTRAPVTLNNSKIVIPRYVPGA
jgi:hypothetical protein